MASIHSVPCFITARFFTWSHCVIGLLLTASGTVDFLCNPLWTRYGYFGLWTGAWAFITGYLGIYAICKTRTSPNKALTAVYLGFSITSAVFAGIIIIVYSITIGPSITNYHTAVITTLHPDDSEFYGPWPSLIPVFMMTLIGIAEFVVGIWTTTWCYMVYVQAACGCCHATSPQQETQMVYTANMPNSGGYMMTQGPGGVPMPFSVQGGGGLIAAQLPSYDEAIGSYPRASPVSGAQPQMVQMPPSGAMESYPQVEPVSGATGSGGEPQSRTSQGVSTSDVVIRADELLLVQMPPSGAMGSYPGATRGEPQSVQGVASSDPALEADELLLVQMPSDETGQYNVTSYV